MLILKTNTEGKRSIPIKAIQNNKGCWICVSHCTNIGGYPLIRRKGIQKTANRVIYEVYVGKIPKEKVVRHTCDNPKCINPKHLILGTQRDNIKDMVERKRTTRGDRSWNTRLNDKKVLEILQSPKTNKELARKFNTDPSVISKIRNRHSWKHIEVE